MDENKRIKLINIGYQVKDTCGTCKHFNSHADPEFGECNLHRYTHRKHTGGERKLSVVIYGSCRDYESTDINFLHGFKEFLTPTE